MTSGPRSADDRWPLLQRIRWRFVLLNLVGVALTPFTLPYLVAQPTSQPLGYMLAMTGYGAWTVLLYRTGGHPLAVRLLGPLLVTTAAITSGHYTWAFGLLFSALFLQSLYGGRGRVLQSAAGYFAGYELAVWVTAGSAEFFSAQLLSMGIATGIMSLVMAQMSRSLRASDDARRRASVSADASRRLLRVGDVASVAQVAVEGVAELVADSDLTPLQVSAWRQVRDELLLTAVWGAAAEAERLALASIPMELVAEYLTTESSQLGPDEMAGMQALFELPAAPEHGLAIPISDGEAAIGALILRTAQALPPDLVTALQRFVDEVSLADRAARRNRLLGEVLANSADGIALVDHAGEFSFVSPAIDELAGRTVPVGATLGSLLVVDHGVGTGASPVTTVAELAVHAGELLVRHQDGELVEVEVSSRAVPGEGTVLNIRDVSRQRRLQDEVQYRAFHDAVTGLPNRARFLDRLEQALWTAADSAQPLAVALLDLDDFKAINDARGHLAGDRLLTYVAERVGSQLRASDTFARIGGDEFALLLDGPGDVAVDTTLEGVLSALREPVTIDGHRIRVSASCGVVVSTGRRTAEEVLRDADLAMYAAKDAGKDGIVFFDADLRLRVDEHRLLLDDLEIGIARDELRLHYQPVLGLSTQDVVGVEALVRWQHPERGLLFPDRFVPLAEESGLIGPLGHWVLLTALRDLADWNARGVVGPDFQMHVNLSAHELADAGLVAEIRTALQVLGVPPAQLVLEITETALTANPDLAERTLRQLRGLGIAIAIDDFGTGYASFTYLRRFPVGIVKIDRSFVADVAAGPEEAALARAIVRLAQSLGMTTVAEGIEDEPARRLLDEWGCDHGQGWMWAKALPIDDLEAWLGSRHGTALAATGPRQSG